MDLIFTLYVNAQHLGPPSSFISLWLTRPQDLNETIFDWSEGLYHHLCRRLHHWEHHLPYNVTRGKCLVCIPQSNIFILSNECWFDEILWKNAMCRTWILLSDALALTLNNTPPPNKEDSDEDSLYDGVGRSRQHSHRRWRWWTLYLIMPTIFGWPRPCAETPRVRDYRTILWTNSKRGHTTGTWREEGMVIKICKKEPTKL